MILKSYRTMAIKNVYGNYEVFNYSLFSVENSFMKNASLTMKRNKHKELTLEVQCPICCEKHLFNYGLYYIVTRDIIIGGCEKLGIPIFYLGKQEVVMNRVNKQKKSHDSICAIL